MKRKTFNSFEDMIKLMPTRVWGEWYLVTADEFIFFKEELMKAPKSSPHTDRHIFTFQGYKLLPEQYLTYKI
jgi:hypothetical protein